LERCGLNLNYYIKPEELNLDLFPSSLYNEEIVALQKYCSSFISEDFEFKTDYFDLLKVPEHLFPIHRDISINDLKFMQLNLSSNGTYNGSIGHDGFFKSTIVSDVLLTKKRKYFKFVGGHSVGDQVDDFSRELGGKYGNVFSITKALCGSNQTNERDVKRAKWEVDKDLLINLNCPNLLFNETAKLVEEEYDGGKFELYRPETKFQTIVAGLRWTNFKSEKHLQDLFEKARHFHFIVSNSLNEKMSFINFDGELSLARANLR
jgi:hypothetical protein